MAFDLPKERTSEVQYTMTDAVQYLWPTHIYNLNVMQNILAIAVSFTVHLTVKIKLKCSILNCDICNDN